VSFWSRIERRIEEITGDLLPDEFSDRLRVARKTLQSGDLIEAEALLLSLTQDRPEHSGAQVLLGTALLKLGKNDDAFSAFELALQYSREMPEALLGRGSAALALDMLTIAGDDFRAAREAAGGDRELLAEAYTGLGTVFRLEGNLDKAIRELRKAVAESKNDASAIAALGEALSADEKRSNQEAKRHLERLAEREGCPAVAWLSLGRIALRDEDAEAAIAYFARIPEDASDDLQIEALLGTGTAQLLLGEGEAAESFLRLALARDPLNSKALARLAEAIGFQERETEALEAYQRSLDVHPDLAVAKKALSLAMRVGDVDRGVLLANQVLGLNAADADALTARGLQLASQNNADAARATYEIAMESGGSQETLLALTRLELDAGNGEQAIAWARRALQQEPADERARALLGACGAASLGVHLQADSKWYDVASATRHLCATHHDLASLLPDASVAVAEYDQPLLVAVMGEFSSGKSSFVNAFVGADVAPTGVTPTTATINMLKYGRKRGGRVVYRDNTSREISGDSLSKSLSDIDDHEARRVRHVEILMPIPALEQVNIVDTPGLNSILPEHEAVARKFLQRADAVVWLFTANQAGKTTEKHALDSIREQGVRVLGVLNKIDQLSDAQIEELLIFVEAELGDRIETCIPISTRRALLGEDHSGWDKLSTQLEERFFQDARKLKEQALARRLTSVHDRALELVGKRVLEQGAQTELLKRSAVEAMKSMLHFIDAIVDQERATINRDAGLLYRQAAREILELVRPRKMPFGSHKASPADRDYLLGLLDSGYEALLDASRTRCFDALRAAASAATAPLDQEFEALGALGELVEEGLRLVDAEVFHSTQSFLRGYLRGGFVDHFFSSQLPSIELQEDAIYHALFRSAPEVDREFSVPLESAGGQLLGDLATRLEDLANRAEVRAFEVDAGLQQALDALCEHRVQLEAAWTPNTDSDE
jgi:tetratricopeptide (TPR) repeat protein